MSAPQSATRCAAYPGGGRVGPSTPCAPLKHEVPGCIYAVGVEPLFDAVFRNFGPGTFNEAFQRARASEYMEAVPDQWDPSPERGGASSSGCQAESTLPKRNARLQRLLPVAAWMRRAVQLPETCECRESWTLFGLGQGRGFVVQISTEVGAGTLLSDCLTVLSRYKAVALDASRTQLDAEVELQWRRNMLLQSRVEQAVVDECRRAFEATFLPLVAQTLGAPTSLPSSDLGSFLDGPPQEPVLISRQERTNSEPEQFHLGDTSSFRPASAAAAGEEGIETEYDGDWSQAPRPEYELRVEVVAAVDLRSPEYRFGDLTAGLVQGPGVLLANVYVQLKVGKRTFVTSCAENPGGQTSVSFPGERALFVLGDERVLKVRAFDKRGLQALIRGDPKIGEGELKIGTDAMDGLPRWADVNLSRSSHASVGSVALRYQLLHLAGGAVVTPALPSEPGDAESDDAETDRERLASLEFVTPPESPGRMSPL